MDSSLAMTPSEPPPLPPEAGAVLRSRLAEALARLESARLLYDCHKEGDALVLIDAALHLAARALLEAETPAAVVPPPDDQDTRTTSSREALENSSPATTDDQRLLEALHHTPRLPASPRATFTALFSERLERRPALLAGQPPRRGEARQTLARARHLLRELETTLEPQLFSPRQQLLRRTALLAARIAGAGTLFFALGWLTLAVHESRKEVSIEGEELADRVVNAPPGVEIDSQRGNWGLSGRRQLYVRASAADQAFDFALEIPEAGRYRLFAYPSRANSYGTIRFSIDGAPLGHELDLYAKKLHAAGEIPLGEARLERGRHVLRVEVVGKHPRSKSFQFGLDRLRLRRES